ncbi:MAG: alpha/beta hydrolase [Hyphomicrobiaceae bacterium]
MATAEAEFLMVGHGADCRRIAYICEPGQGAAAGGPGVMWLPGFKSEMTSTKVSALAEWARQRGTAMTRLDYSGHGMSEGRVEDGSIGRWLEEVRSVFTGKTSGEYVIVGSSMGGYLALLLVRALMEEAPEEARRIKGLVLIAPAWDMTERLMWARFPESVRREVLETGVFCGHPAMAMAPIP